MRLCITGFLAGDNDDDSLQYELVVPPDKESAVLVVLGWQSMSAASDGELPLTSDQVSGLSDAVGEIMPRGLDFFIGVIA